MLSLAVLHPETPTQFIGCMFRPNLLRTGLPRVVCVPTYFNLSFCVFFQGRILIVQWVFSATDFFFLSVLCSGYSCSCLPGECAETFRLKLPVSTGRRTSRNSRTLGLVLIAAVSFNFLHVHGTWIEQPDIHWWEKDWR